MLTDLDINSMYPSPFPDVPTRYYYTTINDNHYSISGSGDIIRWITEALPKAIEYQGHLILNEPEFMMLVLKFGPGQRRNQL